MVSTRSVRSNSFATRGGRWGAHRGALAVFQGDGVGGLDGRQQRSHRIAHRLPARRCAARLQRRCGSIRWLQSGIAIF